MSNHDFAGTNVICNKCKLACAIKTSLVYYMLIKLKNESWQIECTSQNKYFPITNVLY